MKRYISCFLAALFIFLIFPLSSNAVTPLDEAAATAAILVDCESGFVLYEKNADAPVAPASTTKIMTALLVFDAIAAGKTTLDTKVTATAPAFYGIEWDASRVSPYIAEGEALSVRDLLYCVMLHSDCVACNILAIHVSGSVEAFVAQMNTRALELGCAGTNFVNTHGYTANGHTSTARSLYLITKAAMAYEGFAEIVRAKGYTVPATNKFGARTIKNTNALMAEDSSYYYPYVMGVKTGHTDAAGWCLCSYAQKDGRTLICVVLGASQTVLPDNTKSIGSFTETKRLLEWGFSSYSFREIIPQGSIITQVKVADSNNEKVGLYSSEGARYLLACDVSDSDIISSVSLYNESVAAPVSAGDAVGELTVTYNGTVIAQTTLFAANDVAKYVPDTSKNYITMIVILLIVVFLTAATITIITVEESRRYKAPAKPVRKRRAVREEYYDEYDDPDGDFFGEYIPEEEDMIYRHR
ncbi:MAG: D-alanyl-D-alanine carboxypeptidase [Ruminococcaceae bacterium]|nr:D-alanyl-D-alanine carboxypeptidase [Oscillospiraceae bacterium]